ncbi:MAG TPA: DUF4919 domain-containing protein [Rhizomicrobium sp.]|jgi:hypothetical protein|nr:DUF4919 domain-containing protein [Rhizomicrobium sp.]
MKKAALLSLLLLPASLSGALADPAGDYAALVTAAKDGDPGTDYTAMRQAYAMLPEYDPYGKKTNDLMRQGQAAYEAKDCKTALVKFRAAIDASFIISDAHALVADCLEQAGDKEGEKREEQIAQGLFDSIIASGDGEKPETAFHIVTLHEEEAIMAISGVNGTAREQLATDAGPVDKISITDAKTGEKGAVYFNLGAIMIGTAMQKAKPKP